MCTMRRGPGVYDAARTRCVRCGRGPGVYDAGEDRGRCVEGRNEVNPLGPPRPLSDPFLLWAVDPVTRFLQEGKWKVLPNVGRRSKARRRSLRLGGALFKVERYSQRSSEVLPKKLFGGHHEDCSCSKHRWPVAWPRFRCLLGVGCGIASSTELAP
eukprot:364667-Chlamydomonas_euryale.AAC.2